jgi:hypothetical protein
MLAVRESRVGAQHGRASAAQVAHVDAHVALEARRERDQPSLERRVAPLGRGRRRPVRSRPRTRAIVRGRRAGRAHAGRPRRGRAGRRRACARRVAVGHGAKLPPRAGDVARGRRALSAVGPAAPRTHYAARPCATDARATRYRCWSGALRARMTSDPPPFPPTAARAPAGRAAARVGVRRSPSSMRRSAHWPAIGPPRPRAAAASRCSPRLVDAAQEAEVRRRARAQAAHVALTPTTRAHCSTRLSRSTPRPGG